MSAIDNLDWDDLRVFLDVARTGSLAQSAKRLRIDHSTVSRRIAHLESSLGLSVFERTRTGFRLTDSGERVLRHAETIESAVIGIRADVAPEVASGVVRLATMEGIASLYLAPRLLALDAEARDLRLELVTSPQVIHVNRREADLFLSFFKPPGQGLVSEKLGSFAIHAYGSDVYFERFGRPQAECDLANHKFVGYIDDLIVVDAVRWHRDLIGLSNYSFSSNSMIAQMHAASAGLGLVVLPRFAALTSPNLRPLFQESLRAEREIWLNVHQDLQYSGRIKTVVRFLKRQISLDMSTGVL
ncbi:LysR family transcriptional regulator [Bosea vaviloviae]|uniref:LysR family transcriptional regulator n=1 Tax=Bosea vaviloviae TaxID=1526658 RepID=A0A1D7UC72_9HYPH|nr:LysR family transcriptional regulator [Bosea vaviloviae]AOO84967.1 LysR family transcriptional regulator [Bosea vaviloviae]